MDFLLEPNSNLKPALPSWGILGRHQDRAAWVWTRVHCPGIDGRLKRVGGGMSQRARPRDGAQRTAERRSEVYAGHAPKKAAGRHGTPI